jgi:hypothetical protein
MHMYDMPTGQNRRHKGGHNAIHSEQNAECIKMGVHSWGVSEFEDRKSSLVQSSPAGCSVVCFPFLNSVAYPLHLGTHTALEKLKLPPIQILVNSICTFYLLASLMGSRMDPRIYASYLNQNEVTRRNLVGGGKTSHLALHGVKCRSEPGIAGSSLM